MIIDSFDNKSESKINPKFNEDAYKLDICILTFSKIIEEYVLNNYKCEKIGQIKDAADIRDIYKIDYKGKKIGFFKTYVGAPSCVGSIETSSSQIKTDKFILFGGAGCLNKEITHGKVMVPTEAYRDEGTSYHYAQASDYIPVKNHDVVSEFMKKNEIPFIEGRTWTTDAFYRETLNNFEKRKADGCISVEMECSAVQAMCDFRNLEFYTFFTSGDLLDSPKWDERRKNGELQGTQHDSTHFDIAIELANFILDKGNTLELIPYTDNDYNFIYETKKNAYKNYVEQCWGYWDEFEQRNRFKESMAKTRDITFIIALNDEKIGFYQGELVNAETYYIENICIIPDYQGKGFGTKILKNILEKYCDKDIEIQYFKQNPVGKLYASLGFVPNGETEFHYRMIKRNRHLV